MSEVPGQNLTLELSSDEVARLDAWISAQPDPRPSRAEATRQFLVHALSEATLPAPPAISDEAAIPEGPSGAADPYDGAPM